MADALYLDKFVETGNGFKITATLKIWFAVGYYYYWKDKAISNFHQENLHLKIHFQSVNLLKLLPLMKVQLKHQ